MKDLLYLGAYNSFEFLVRRLPEKIKFPILRSLAAAAYRLDRRHRRIARINLDLVFGREMSEAEKERIIRATYENLLFLLHDFVLHQSMSKEALLKKVRFVNAHYIEEALALKRPIVFISGHFGNWELASLAFAAQYGPISVVGRPLESKRMNEKLKKGRERFGVELIEKRGALKKMIKALKSGRAVGLLVDQNTAAHDGVVIDFFGKKARHTPAAALLAKRTDAAVIPVFVTSEDHKSYRVEILPPIEMRNSGDAEADILDHVQRQADVTAEMIRQHPEAWFWLHKRWFTENKALYEDRTS